MAGLSGAVAADVVVVGGGGAGLCAAAAAARAGAEVVLVTKARPGAANATAYAGGGFTVSPSSEGPFTPEDHFRLSLETGRSLADHELLRTLCLDGPRAVRELETDFGVRFDWSPGGCSVHRFGRPPLLGGVGLTAPLVDFIRRAGCRILDQAVVTTIVQEGDRPAGQAGPAGPGRGEARGVLAVVPSSGEVWAVEAPAVVVATGGGGAVYGHTDNPPRMTGDGYALLREAGAFLRDMEFVQFYPLGLAEPGAPSRLLDTGLLDVIRLTDEAGRDPLAGCLGEWGVASGAEINLRARDRAAVALGRHVAAGHRLYLHTEELPESGCPADLLEEVRRTFPRTIDPFARPVAVAPVQHYFCGGAVISPDGAVAGKDGPIPGLYACGEVTGGVDGANRVGGNALTNIVTFGLAAGRAAAACAARSRARVAEGRRGPRRAPDVSGPAWTTARESLLGRLAVLGDRAAGGGRAVGGTRQGPRPRPSDIRRELQDLADRYLGPVRSGAGLTEALSALDDLARRAAAVRARPGPELLIALEASGAVATAALLARAALERTESRGCHFREDFPAEDPDWLRPVVIGF
ncbi:MAG: FAD-dependent oxidoreductase [Bacillota bacterium]|jgi:succinate dehydrogenase/fumarate reductase flavoprotein subunit